MAISGNIPNAMGDLLLILTMGVGGIMVSIAAFQAVDPGSIPGRRIFFLKLSKPNLTFRGHAPRPVRGKPALQTIRPYQMTLSKVVSYPKKPPWRNRLARSAVNRKVGGSSPPGGDMFFSKQTGGRSPNMAARWSRGMILA